MTRVAEQLVYLALTDLTELADLPGSTVGRQPGETEPVTAGARRSGAAAGPGFRAGSGFRARTGRTDMDWP